MKLHHLIFALLLPMVVSCGPGAFDPAKTDAEVPALEIREDREPLITAEGKLYWHGRPFSGRLLSFHDNGLPAGREGYLEGRRHGDSEFWYAGGQQRERRFYREGKKEGLHLGWWENGQRRFEHSFLNGESHGPALDWNAEGLLVREFNYENGRESGHQRMWKADGRIRANYEVRGGRRYGYIGTKNCVTVSDNSANNPDDEKR